MMMCSGTVVTDAAATFKCDRMINRIFSALHPGWECRGAMYPTTGCEGLIRYLTVKILTVGGEIDKAL